MQIQLTSPAGAVLRIFSLTTILVVLTGACSPAPMPISRSSNDPSSSSAPEGISPLLTPSASTTVPAEAQHDHEDHSAHARHGEPSTPADAGSDGAVYVCPMHPEVTSTSPGQVCPKCNMKLVPKE